MNKKTQKSTLKQPTRPRSEKLTEQDLKLIAGGQRPSHEPACSWSANPYISC
ncbi:MAG TPA: hypothetical protein VL463_29935 [Kofleriaceae bacterium]|jgi:hypothetical protein|nr:hypothetical protein [Kofleriaceae bacterium]